MSDEHLNNEETSALFVSAQKKKKAEEEAARKAAEEKAKREAAEAEVRRMEAEVEERKRKAEEEKKALEEQEKQLAQEKLNGPKETKAEPEKKKEPKKASIKEELAGKSKLPLYIGIGAVAVIAVVLILVFALKGKGGAVALDPATTEFNAEYVSKEEGFDLKFSYPDSVYKEVTEEKTGDDEVIIHFGGADVIMTTCKEDDGDTVLQKSNVFFKYADSLQKEFQEKVTARVKELIPDIKVISETGVDVGADNADKYEYKCTFESAKEGNGAVASWIAPNSKGEFKRVIVCVKASGANADECANTCALFEEKNSETALTVPGAKPPVATDSDGMLEIDDIHLGLVVPKDEYTRYERDDITHYVFYDENGAMVIVAPVDAGGDILSTTDIDTMKDMFKKWVDRGINDYYSGVSSRMNLDENFVAEETGINYTANFKDMIGGVTFWERYRAAYWFDERQQKDFYYIVITLAPSRNEDVYKPIFDKMLDMPKDL